VYKIINRQAVCENSESITDCTCSGKIKDQFPEINLVGTEEKTLIIDPNRYMQKVFFLFYVKYKIIQGKTIRCVFFINSHTSFNETHVLLGSEYLKDFIVKYDINGESLTMIKLYDVYWKYDLMAILISLLLVLTLVAMCIVLMLRYDRKISKEDIIKSELRKGKKIRKYSDL